MKTPIKRVIFREGAFSIDFTVINSLDTDKKSDIKMIYDDVTQILTVETPRSPTEWVHVGRIKQMTPMLNESKKS